MGCGGGGSLKALRPHKIILGLYRGNGKLQLPHYNRGYTEVRVGNRGRENRQIANVLKLQWPSTVRKQR